MAPLSGLPVYRKSMEFMHTVHRGFSRSSLNVVPLQHNSVSSYSSVHLKTCSVYFTYLAAALCIAAIFSFTGCASRKKNKPRYNTMQNISTRYNILYNSQLLLQEATRVRQASHPDNYQQLLNVFQEPAEASIQASEKLMDSLIGKCNRIIQEK